MRNVLISHPYPPKEKRWAFHCMFSLLNHPTYPPLKVTSRSDLLKHRYLKQLGDGKPPFLPRKIPWERGNPPRPLNPNKNKHSKGGGLVENRDGNDHGFACVFFWGGGNSFQPHHAQLFVLARCQFDLQVQVFHRCLVFRCFFQAKAREKKTSTIPSLI